MRRPVPDDVQPISEAPTDGTPVILWDEIFGYDMRVSMWINGAWRQGRDGVFTSLPQRATHFRLATEEERHLDQDFDESRLPDLNVIN